MKILISIFILIFSYNLIFACMCVNKDFLSDKEYSELLQTKAAIFYGEVIDVGEKRTMYGKTLGGRSYPFIVQKVKFKVLRVWKGVEELEISVETNASDSCQFIPVIGERYKVYADKNKEFNIPIFTDYCSVSSFDEERMKLEYGEGRVFEEPEQESRQNKPAESFLAMIWQKIISFFT